MNIKHELVNRSPSILLGAGIVGFISAAIMSAKATPRAMEILNEVEYLDLYTSEESTRLERVRRVAPVYLPTAGMLFLSAGLVLSSDRIIRKRYASLLALYSITERALAEWESATRESVPKKKFNEIKNQALAPGDPPPDEEERMEGRSWFWDPYSGRFFSAHSVDSVKKAFGDINLTLIKEEGFVPLNDLYDLLGMYRVGYGDDIGWNIEDGEIYPSLDSVMYHDQAYIRLTYDVKPRKWT